jgi:hypothetical protein
MPTFPAPETGILLTHFIVSEDIAQQQRDAPRRLHGPCSARRARRSLSAAALEAVACARGDEQVHGDLPPATRFRVRASLG